MLISTGSTRTPRPSSHLIDALMSARAPSISRQTMPISSVTLACRTFVMTGNFWLNCQMTGVVINLGGNISHRRVFCGPAGALFLGGDEFFVVRGIVIVNLSAGDGRDDADLIAIFEL